MFRNYLSAALRSMARNRLYAALNIGGLAIGIATAIFVGLFIRDELSYDRFFPGHEQLYRVTMSYRPLGQDEQPNDRAYFRIAEWLKMDFPRIQAVARWDGSWVSLRYKDTEYHQEIFYADSKFFEVFPFRAIAGDPSRALDDPGGAVLTRKMARKLFGEDAPIGKTFDVLRQWPLRVNAVIEDPPPQTHLNITLVAPARFATSPLLDAENLEQRYKLTEPRLASYTYIRLQPGTSAAALERQMPDFVRRHLPLKAGEALHLDLQPVTQIHLSPARGTPLKPAGNTKMLIAMAWVGVFILFIACLNFVNLTTASGGQRFVEIGVRKASGAEPRDLMLQFLGESVLCVGIAMLLAIALVEVSLPALNVLLDRSLGKFTAPGIVFDYWRDPRLAGTLIAGVMLVGVAAGFYPAFVLARLRAANVLKGSVQHVGSFSLRRAFVVVQFTILVVLIIVTAVIERQTLFAVNEGLRIDRHQVLLVFFQDRDLRNRFQQALTDIPGVEAVTSSLSSPTNWGLVATSITRPGMAAPTTLFLSAVDYNFHEFYKLPLLAGRYFSKSRGTDVVELPIQNGRAVADAVKTPAALGHAVSVILNESAMHKLGIASPRAAIGQTLRADTQPVSNTDLTIVGVVPDFPIDVIAAPIQPMVYLVLPPALRIVSARLDGRRIPETLARIDALWKQVGEPRAIARQFLDEYYDYLYTGERQQAKVFAAFSAVAISIACLGLFGLSVFNAQRRTKEIGIRKAMGADQSDILRLLVWQFTKPVLLSIAIAAPIGALLMKRWLETFANRISLEPWLVIGPGVAALTIALLTVGAHCYLVARRKPVSALRYE